jgi:DNA uptake protein ComE-like DNA-binding protein
MNRGKRMKKQNHRQPGIVRYRQGMALAITLMVLVVLSGIVATLAVRVSQVRQRQQYIMNYQKALYSLDSAIKYAMVVVPEKRFTLIVRADAPDFSDLFWLSQDQYLEYIDAWIAGAEVEQVEKYLKKTSDEKKGGKSQSLFGQMLSKFMDLGTEPNEPNEPNEMEDLSNLDPNQIVVPGPYGPAWPNVIEPVKLEIGGCEVTLSVEDENAKMPLSWLVTNRVEANKQAKVALQTFTEWMGVDEKTLASLTKELEELSKYKMFTLSNSTILLPPETASATTQTPQQPSPASRSRQRRTNSRRTAAAAQQSAQTQPQAQKVRPEVAHAADFAKLFHSSLLDTESLAVPRTQMAFEDESPMKYLALWGSQRVNINTAPRQVLEAAFTFGGKSVDVAEAIILARKEKPFKSVADLKSKLSEYGDSIQQAAPYIDAESKVFTIRVTSRCGNASVSAVAAVIKEGKQMERLIILYGR